MKKHVFIINPEAGKKKGVDLIPYIKNHFVNIKILMTRYPGHATELAKENAGTDVVIYSVGGDGTINEVINGVLQSEYVRETVIAAVPSGSGNDFIKSITDIKDPKILLEHYKKQNVKSIDIGLINGRSFVNIASVGFDAEIVSGAKKYKSIPYLRAELAYIISVFTTIVNLKDYCVSVTIDGRKVLEKSILFITMANGNYYGGGMKVAPNAKIDDGLLNYYIVNKIKRRQVPFLLPKYMKGRHKQIKVLQEHCGKKIKITSNKPIPINIDGEVYMDKQVEVEIKEGAIKILVP